MTTTTTDILAVFFDGKHWLASTKTPNGFRHHSLGTATSFSGKAAAEKVANDLSARGWPA